MHIWSSLLCVSLLWISDIYSFGCRSFMTYRPQEQNLARNVAGWQSLRTDIFNGDACGNASVAVEYDHSFDPSAIN